MCQPLFYVNKMDLPGADKALRLRELRGRFGDGCVDFTPAVPAEERAEALGVCSEPLMEAVLATGTVPAGGSHHGNHAAAGVPLLFWRGSAAGWH